MRSSVLIVDDDTSILDGFKEILSKEDFSVDTAENEREALTILKQKQYQLVLTDIVLKETTGLELISKIKEINSETLVVMITAYPTTESAIRSFKVGAFDYLIKPVKKTDLIETIRRGLERKNQQEEVNSVRRIKEALEHAHQEKAIFLMQISRDIDEAMIDMIKDINFLIKMPISEKQVEALSALKTKSLFLHNLANNIVDIAKIETGKLELKEEDFELTHVLEEVAKNVYPAIKGKPVEFFYEIDKEIPRYLKGDQYRLKQILMNLLSNAIHYTQEGEIRLKARLMTVLGRGCHIFFVVQDSGEGIPKEKQMDIFKPRSMEHVLPREAGALPHSVVGSQARKESSGLGLWLCKVLVEKMGGLISLHSEQGKGSEFRFSVRFNLVIP
ncbi:MAG: response regulator [Candidatus Omnitrophota bacterium]